MFLINNNYKINIITNINNWFKNIKNFLFKNKKKANKNVGFRGAIDRRDLKSRIIAIENFYSKEELDKEMDKLLARTKKIGFENLNQKDKERMKEISKKI